MTDDQLAVALAVVAWVNPQVTSLGLVSHRVDRSMAPHPQTPANVFTDCPKLVLRLYRGNLLGRPNRGVDFDWALSYWYYRRQVPGQAHQELLVPDVLLVEGLFLGNFGPELILAAGADYIAPVQTVWHDERNHKSREPRLRASCAEILLGVKAHKD